MSSSVPPGEGLHDPFLASSDSATAPSPTASTSSVPMMASRSRGAGPASRNSARPSGSAPTSHMESTITRLLVATKQLLEGLAKWSRGELSEEAISEIYVKLGNDFNVACAAFARENIGMSELLSVPSDLRICLETCLSEVPSQSTLERHLPKVRQIIIGLLHGLREKQRLYRDGVAARRVRETKDHETARLQQQRSEGTPPVPDVPIPGDHRTSMISSSSGGSSTGPSSARPQQPILKEPLSPESASKSRDDLRRFVSHAQHTTVQSLPGTRSTSPLPPPLPSMAPPPVPTTSGAPRPPLDKRRSMSTEDVPGAGARQSAIPVIPVKPSRSTMRDSNHSMRSASATSEADGEFGAITSGAPASSSLRGSYLARRQSAERTRAYSPPPPPREDGEPVPVPSTPTYDPITGQTIVVASPRPSPPDQPPPSSRALYNAVTSEPAPAPASNMAQLQSLEALRQSDHLSRRASKRYSAYAIQKITTGAGSPIRSPNERRVMSGPQASSSTGGSGEAGSMPRSSSGLSAGRELAIGDERAGGKRSAPSRKAKSEFRPSRASVLGPVAGAASAASSPLAERDPQIETIVEEASGGSQDGSLADSAPMSNGSAEKKPAGHSNALPAPPPPEKAARRSSSSSSISQIASATNPSSVAPARNASVATMHSSDSDVVEFPISVFLQIGRDVKKAQLAEEPTLASLKLLFVERFQYNPGANDFPPIYVRDGEFGVHYELEDMREVKNGAVLSLNIDTVEQVKQHIDQGLLTLSQDIKELRSTMTAMRRVSVTASHPMFSPDANHMPGPPLAAAVPEPSEQQYQDAAQKVLRMRRLGSVTTLASPQTGGEEDPKPPLPPAPAQPSPTLSTSSTVGVSLGLDANQVVTTLKTQHEQVQNLRREIGVLRQVYSDFGAHTKNVFAAMRVETSRVHKLASTTRVGKSRAFVEAGVTKLDQDVSDLVVKVDEVQDTIEQMRADVVRGVRPRPGHLSETTLTLKKIVEMRDSVADRLGTTKPSWAHTWSEELAKVLGEQETVQKHESMLVDLADDLNDVKDVLRNIEAVAKSARKLTRTKSGRRGLGSAEEEGDGAEVDLGQSLSNVLLEVQGLQPNANKRLEAIAKAERQRELELANRTDDFADELEDFVQGGKLKKSGGVEETERLRQARSEATLKAMFAG